MQESHQLAASERVPFDPSVLHFITQQHKHPLSLILFPPQWWASCFVKVNKLQLQSHGKKVTKLQLSF